MKLHHVGIVTRDIAKCTKLYLSLGYSQLNLVDDPIQIASIALMQRDGEPIIELIAPKTAESPAHQWLDRIKAGAYHICYESPSLENAISSLRELGFAVIMDPVPAIAFDNRRVAFLWSPLTGLVELLESGRL